MQLWSHTCGFQVEDEPVLKGKGLLMCLRHTKAAFFTFSCEIPPLTCTFFVSPWYQSADQWSQLPPRNHHKQRAKPCHQPPGQDTNTGVNQPRRGSSPILAHTQSDGEGGFQTTKHPQCCLILNYTSLTLPTNAEPTDGQCLFRKEARLNDVRAGE